MRSTRLSSLASTWLFATILTLTASAAAAAPASVSSGPRMAPTVWGLVQETWRALFGLDEVKVPATPVDNLTRGPLIDPDGNATARQARPRAS